MNPTQEQANRVEQVMSVLVGNIISRYKAKDDQTGLSACYAKNKDTGEYGYLLCLVSPGSKGTGKDLQPIAVLTEPNIISATWEPCHPDISQDFNDTDSAHVISTDGLSRKVAPKNGTDFTLEEMQKIVGGYIQTVGTKDGRTMVLNEEGKLEGLPLNRVATEHYVYGAEDPICGDVLVCPSSMIK